MKTSLKSKKIGTILKQKLPFIFQEIINPEEFGFLTIIAIDVSIDGKYAHIFVKSIGGKKDFIDRLNRLAPKIAHEVIQLLPNKKKIELRFKEDSSADILEKIGPEK